MSQQSAVTSRAVICVRVSPRPAENVRYSPEIQEAKCREWCDARGIPVVAVIQDILVSGGSANRFDSIRESVARDRPTHLIVSDISRWTRDHPMRYWTMQAWLADQKISLISVDQSFIGGDGPFSATIATAIVEANYLQRLELNRKTSDGVRRALAAGKRVSAPWGWSFDRDTRQWVHDDEKIRGLYEDVASGMGLTEVGRKYGLRPFHIAGRVGVKAHQDVVGMETWLAAQRALRHRARAPRRDAQQSNIWRGLLICPFCGGRLQHKTNAWGNYACHEPSPHEWRSISATKHAAPAVRGVIDRMILPEDDTQLLRRASGPAQQKTPDLGAIKAEIERLGILWSQQRLSDKTFEERVAKLEAELEETPAPPPSPRVQIEMLRSASLLDLDVKDPVGGAIVNETLHEIFGPITVLPDRSVRPEVKQEYLAWLT